MRVPAPPTSPRLSVRVLWRAWLAALLLGGLTGCSHLGYYWQSVSGHVQLMRAARPIPDWLADPATPPLLKTRLASAQALRDYAARQLGLPDNASYHRYADLHRSAVIWNVTAAPPDALTLHTWCFPVTGCIGYRGYFDVQAARAEAAGLREQGLETHVYGVPAYSTLGWLNWAGGDPLLNTFIHYPEGELARLIFHELAHQVVYLNGDTTFNESFATAVELIGVRQWLAQAASPAARQAYAQSEALRLGFRDLTRATRARLEAVYAQARAPGSPPDRLTRQKAEVMADFRRQYAALRSQWTIDPTRQAGYDQWVANANNAAFGALAAYDALVPGFEALYEQQRARQPEQAWPLFYEAVRQLARLPEAERLRRLQPPAPVSSAGPSTPSAGD